MNDASVERICAQIDDLGKQALDTIGKLQKERDDLQARLFRINLLACYATEENTDARYQCLLEIGKLARMEMEP